MNALVERLKSKVLRSMRGLDRRLDQASETLRKIINSLWMMSP